MNKKSLDYFVPEVHNKTGAMKIHNVYIGSMSLLKKSFLS